MDFLTFLNKYEHEDVSGVQKLVQSNKTKEAIIIKEAFNSEYPSKKEALFNVEHDFLSEGKVPKGVDVEYLRKNLKEIKAKIEQLDEGDIRIIIHNHEGKKDKAGTEMGVAEEEVKIKGKRGRPRKAGRVEEPTEVVDGEPEIVSAVVVDKPEEEIGGEVSEVKWDDIEKSLAEEDEKDALVEQLSNLQLDDEELKSATDMAESGVIEEDGGRIAEAASIINKISSL